MLVNSLHALVLGALLVAIYAASKPPKEIPPHLKDRYSVNGTVGIASFYVDDTNGGEETHFIFSEKSMDSYLKGIKKSFARVLYLLTRARIEETEVDMSRLEKSDWIFFAMHKYVEHIGQGSVVVFGSSEPTYEVAALSLDAKHVTTVEYNNLTYAHPMITTISKYHFQELYACNSPYQNSFDVAISISSFDHDGLGRYGDPLDPEGDLKAMHNAMSVVKPGGIMLLTVPIGPDLVVFNLLRRYGEVRLPLLLSGWEVIDRLFWDEAKLTEPVQNYRRSYEPVLVLRKPVDNVAPLCIAVDDISTYTVDSAEPVVESVGSFVDEL